VSSQKNYPNKSIDFTQTYHHTKHKDLQWIQCYITAQQCTVSMLVPLVTVN